MHFGSGQCKQSLKNFMTGLIKDSKLKRNTTSNTFIHVHVQFIQQVN